MSRIVQSLLCGVLLVALAGCSNADKPAAETATPKRDPEEIQKGIDASKAKMKDSPSGAPTAAPGGGEEKK